MSSEENLFDVIKILKLTLDNYSKKIDSVAKELGITKGEADVLLFFSNNPTFLNAKDAVFKTHVSKSFVSKAIALLIRKKYIKILIDENDKRFQKIVITKKAEKVVKILNATQQSYFGSLKNNINENEFISFIKVLETFEENIFKMEGLKMNVKDV